MSDPDATPTPVFTWLTKGQEWDSYKDGVHTSGTDYTTDFHDATVAQIDLSGTGMEQTVFAVIAGYLRDLTKDPRPTLYDYDSRVDRGEKALAAELAANAGFVEYGVSLRCAWLDDNGKAWLADYDKHCAKQSEQ